MAIDTCELIWFISLFLHLPLEEERNVVGPKTLSFSTVCMVWQHARTAFPADDNDQLEFIDQKFKWTLDWKSSGVEGEEKSVSENFPVNCKE